MDIWVFWVVLLAAVMHAGWNALVKSGADQFISITALSVVMGVLAIPMLPFVEFPREAAWGWLLASTILHTGYKLFLIQAYRAGDMSQVYPIARGTAPMIVAIVGVVFLSEYLGPAGYLGIAVVTLGLWLMAFHGGATGEFNKRAVGFALVTSLFIAAYTLVDGLGARANGSVAGFVVWLFSIDAIAMVAVAVALRGSDVFISSSRRTWQKSLIGGTMSLGAYWVIIWAMTITPIALVAALRETSVLFALVISVLFLGEKMTRWRAGAAGLVVAGAAMMRVL
ncbi:MAG: EamA family transporter [Alphaproteobacteria bacterium]